MKRCPRCAEKIQTDARVCRFCLHEQPEPESNAKFVGVIIGVILLAALANKTARIAWAVMRKNESYRAPALAA